MRRLKLWHVALLIFVCAFLFGGINLWTSRAQNLQADSEVSAGQNGAAAQIVHGFDVSSLDRSVNACVDFNMFANGGWIARNPVPAAYPRWGRFNELAER